MQQIMQQAKDVKKKPGNVFPVRSVMEEKQSSLQQLQQNAGNLALNQYFLQPKLTISQSGDRYEEEADQVANFVMRKSTNESALPKISPVNGSSLQRMCEACEQEDLVTEVPPMKISDAQLMRQGVGRYVFSHSRMWGSRVFIDWGIPAAHAADGLGIEAFIDYPTEHNLVPCI